MSTAGKKETELKKLKNVDQQLLLEQLHERFTTSQKKWKIKAAVFAVLYFTFLVVVALLQVAQVVVFQLDNSVVSKSVKTSVGTILPAITGGVLAVQMRLLWDHKRYKSKKNIALFQELKKQTEPKTSSMGAGGSVEDVTPIWKAALKKEPQGAPGFLITV